MSVCKHEFWSMVTTSTGLYSLHLNKKKYLLIFKDLSQCQLPLESKLKIKQIRTSGVNVRHRLTSVKIRGECVYFSTVFYVSIEDGNSKHNSNKFPRANTFWCLVFLENVYVSMYVGRIQFYTWCLITTVFGSLDAMLMFLRRTSLCCFFCSKRKNIFLNPVIIVEYQFVW